MLDVASSLSPTAGERSVKGYGIDDAVVDRWKAGLDVADIYWCESSNGGRMRQLGYELTNVQPGWPLIALSFASLPFKFGLAALLNYGKMLNVVKSVRRRFTWTG